MDSTRPFIAQIYKYLPCSSKFFPPFMLMFKGSRNHSRDISSTLYRRHNRLRHVHFCSKVLQVVHCAELPLMAGLEESSLHSSTKVTGTLGEGCNLQCFCKLCLPPSHEHGTFWGVITAYTVHLATVNPYHCFHAIP